MFETVRQTVFSPFAKGTLAACVVGILSLQLQLPGAYAQNPGGEGCARTYTLDGDFDEGALINVNHDSPNNDQLQLSSPANPLPFVNIACSGRGTVARIDVNSGVVVGEYNTAPAGRLKNPSRTTVDLGGNCWVGNRSESSGGRGSVARIGIVLGGTRTDSTGTPLATGEYLQPPFIYNTCIDQDFDGLIRTSNGLANILDWDAALTGVDDNGGVATADDECVINYVRTAGTGVRTVAVDANNDLWVGGLINREHEKIDGVTGIPVLGTQFNISCGGYGGVIDCNNVLWSARSLVRAQLSPLTPVCITDTGIGNYGLGIDPNTGNIWYSSSSFLGSVYELDPSGALLNSYPQGFGAQGLAVDNNSHVWVAEIFGSRILHLAPNPFFPGTHYTVGVVTGFGGTTGVACDSNGKIWASETGNSASRVDPAAGPAGAIPPGGSVPIDSVGAIDLTVPLGAGANPYNYSDMTGKVVLGATANSGTWTVVHNSGIAGTDWGTVSWNSSEPAGTGVKVDVRASDDVLQLPTESFVRVNSGELFCASGVEGQYLEIRVTLCRDQAEACSIRETPILFDLTVDCCTDCISVTNEQLVCDQETPGAYNYSLDVTNDSGVDVHRIKLLPCDGDGDLVPDFTITPSSFSFSPALANGATTTLNVTVSGASPDKEVCFEIWMLDENLEQCCVIKHCIKPPECCFEVCDLEIACIPGSGDFLLTFNLLNKAPYDLDRLFLWPAGNFAFSPDNYILAPTPTETKTGSLVTTISGPDAFSGNILCFDITTHEAATGECCGKTVCVTLPDCCQKEDFCHVTKNSMLCPVRGSDILETRIQLTICNNCNPEDTVFDWSIDGLGGGPLNASHFSPQSGSTSPIPQGGCETIDIIITTVNGELPPNPPSQFEVMVINSVTGEITRCRGSVKPPGQGQIKGHSGDPADPDRPNPHRIPFGEPRSISFAIENLGAQGTTVEYELVTRLADGTTGPGTLSLDGLPLGEPVRGGTDLPGRGTVAVKVNAQFPTHEPFVFYDIILMADTDGDGSPEELASHAVRSVMVVDCNINGVPDDVDIALGISADVDGNGVPDGCEQPGKALIFHSPRFFRGDGNADGNVDLSDAVYGLGFLFLGAEDPQCMDAMDTNDSGRVDISDAVSLLNFLFLGDQVPSAPGPSACGIDPTDDDVTCESFAPCSDTQQL